MKKIITTLFLMTSFLSLAEVIIDTSNTKPAINEPFNIQVKFLNEDKKDYEIEGIENLQILSRGTRSNYSYINGNKTSEKIDSYTVIANEIKNFPLSINITGKNVKSNVINIEVQQQSLQNTSQDMSVETNIKDGDSFYFGEKIIYEENFLTTTNINSISYSRAPQFDDFSVKNISPVYLTGSYEQNYFRASSGKQGIKLGIYRGILQPNSSGEKFIKAGQMAVTQSTGRHDFFFEESTPPKYFGGNDIKINILPLPPDKPLGFQNLIGKPVIDYSWNSDNINLGQSALLSVKIFGNVNLDSLEKIITQQFNDFNIFESVKNSNEKVINGEYYAEKTFEIALIPKKNGELSTPEIKIPYFNTKLKKYDFLTIPSKKINVTGHVNTSNSIPNQVSTDIDINDSILEEVKIDTVENSKNQIDKSNNFIIIGLITLIIVEGFIIIYLLVKKEKKISVPDIRDLKNAKDDKEFFEAYCNFMKKRYSFSPKVHLEDKLIKLGLSKEFIEINRELESAYYNSTPIAKKNIISRLKRELKNEK